MGILGTGSCARGAGSLPSQRQPPWAWDGGGVLDSRCALGVTPGHDVITGMVISRICPYKFLLVHPFDNHC